MKTIENYTFVGKSRTLLDELALHHPAVRGALLIYLRGDCSWDEMMIGLVEFLVNQNKNMFDELVKIQMNKIDPAWEQK